MHKLSNIVSRFKDIPLTGSDTRPPPPKKKKKAHVRGRGEKFLSSKPTQGSSRSLPMKGFKRSGETGKKSKTQRGKLINHQYIYTLSKPESLPGISSELTA